MLYHYCSIFNIYSKETSAWDRYVIEEYELLVAEEGNMHSVECEDDSSVVEGNSYEELLKPNGLDSLSIGGSINHNGGGVYGTKDSIYK